VTKPAGRTFRERWSADAATEDWLLDSTVAVAAGGIGGLFAVPVVAAQAMTAFPVIAAVLALTVAVAFLPGRRHGRVGGASRRAWTLAVYLLLAGACGLILGALFGVFVAVACPSTGCEHDTSHGLVISGPLLFAQAVLVLASVACSVAAAVMARSLTIRLVNPKTVVDPATLAWRDRRQARAEATGKDEPGTLEA
jgi:hypothetical protein